MSSDMRDNTTENYIVIGKRVHHVDDFLAGNFGGEAEGDYDVSWPWPERLQ